MGNLHGHIEVADGAGCGHINQVKGRSNIGDRCRRRVSGNGSDETIEGKIGVGELMTIGWGATDGALDIR